MGVSLYGWEGRSEIVTENPVVFKYIWRDHRIGQQAHISVLACAGELTALAGSGEYTVLDTSATTVLRHYGPKRSRIGDVPVALRYENTRWGTTVGAVFTLGNTGYEVSSRNVSQREFVELLLSICEAPRENTQDVVAYVLEKDEEARDAVRELLAKG